MLTRVKTISIGERKIGPGHGVYVIAEAGVNHNGDVAMAEEMIKVAAHCGADAIKFQAFRTDSLASRAAPLADYQKKSARAGGARTQRTMLKELELQPADFLRLKSACEKARIEFLVTPFDLESLKMLFEMNVRAIKIASPEITDVPLLEAVAARKVPALLSTGASNLAEVKEALAILRAGKLVDIALLHCVSSYPAPYEQSNLRAIAAMRDYFGLPVGFSDHSPGIHIGVAAVAAGALLVEKHFTLDRKLPGPDQPLSLEPSELHSFVTAIRQVDKALGSGVKEPQSCETNVREAARKSLVAVAAIKKGEKVAAGMLTTKRPATGIEPKFFRKVVGRRAKCDIAPDTVLTWDMV